jgi:GTP-binding protein Era
LTDPGTADATGFKSGYVALVGPPNAGKSTLLNHMLKYPVSIVAPRPQTTRHRVLGILNGEGFQALFLDTPGVLVARYRLQEMMRREVEQALRDADVVLLLLDGSRTDDWDESLRVVRGRGALVAVNKIDLLDKPGLLPLARRLSEQGYTRVWMISALKGDGIDGLRQGVVDSLPEGPPLYPTDMMTDRSERFHVAEIVREVVFNRYGEEVPYSCTVSIDEFKEREGRKDFIRAVVYVERASQRAIIIGKGGSALRQVGVRARARIERFLGRPVYLELWVRVAEAWRQDGRFLRENVYRQGPG